MSLHTTTRRGFVTAVGVAGVSVAGTGIASGRRHDGVFVAHLSGEGVVPSVDTGARGLAVFQFDRAGGELRFKLIAARIEDVFAAHIHCAPAGENGPVGVTLFEGEPTSDSGLLVEGSTTEPDEGNECDWADLDEVVGAIQSGEAYVNVHTEGYPDGEIRGQIH